MSAPAPIPAGSFRDLADWTGRELAVGRVAVLQAELLERVAADYTARGRARQWTGAYPTTAAEYEGLRARLLDEAMGALTALVDIEARWQGTLAACAAPEPVAGALVGPAPATATTCVEICRCDPARCDVVVRAFRPTSTPKSGPADA